MDVQIRHLGAGDENAVLAASALFDRPPDPVVARRFLAERTHHLLVAYDKMGVAVGFVSGVETIHPDKGTEMVLYELSVDAPARRHGIGRSLVEALATVARQRGCHGMWTGTERDNLAALDHLPRSGGSDSATRSRSRMGLRDLKWSGLAFWSIERPEYPAPPSSTSPPPGHHAVGRGQLRRRTASR